MNATFRTHVTWLPPTPLGLLPGRWHIEHYCTACRSVVTTDELVDHARAHAAAPQPPTGVLDR